MKLEEFKASLQSSEPPAGFSVYHSSLWYDAKGEWERAHELIQDIQSSTASWIHAYLHRKEGDIGNADYWYSKAGKRRPEYSLEQEASTIIESLPDRNKN